MEIRIVFLVPLFLCLVCQAAKPKEKPIPATGNLIKMMTDSEDESPQEYTTRCGEVMTGDSNGIFYKPFEPVMNNERCVWTIATPDATGYRVKVLYLGYSSQTDGDQQIILSGFGRNQANPTHVIANSTGNFMISNKNILFVTFYSGPSSNSANSHGFVLQYKADYTYDVGELEEDSVYFVNEESTHVLINTQELFRERHPRDADGYLWREFSSFVFLPENNVYTASKNFSVLYLKEDVELCCDYLDVYYFNANANHLYKWEHWTPAGYSNSITGEVEAKRLTHDDLLLVLFTTDSSVELRGFQFMNQEKICQIS